VTTQDAARLLEPARNEAAERLRLQYVATLSDEQGIRFHEVLAAERRATVERIRAAVEHGYTTKSLSDILDEEAAR
jgi:hypothetical protein